ncbi:hypothetical protein L1049_026271 [Liquidambar formosana]|uniref:nepenthesin n=1 Tax=Liquidambar formosana TaxID=63359 RepID=A0AAP0R758_LIQFO
MAPSPPPFSSLFPLLTISLLLLPLAYSTSRSALNHHAVQFGFRIGLTHVDDGRNFTKLQLIQRAINRGKQRLNRINAMATTAPTENIRAPVHVGHGSYLMNFWIGTPARPLLGIMDTGSDLIWTQCKPCVNCFNQPTPIFDPRKSSSFSKISCSAELCRSLGNDSKCDNNGCEYNYYYADDTTSKGFLAMDTFTFGESTQKVSIPNIGFGCGVNNEGKGVNQSDGIVGLGRGPSSLVTQLGSRKFSYCLTSVGGKKQSSLLFGSLADLNHSNGEIRGTPLIYNPVQPTFYYLTLEGISVGEALLPIPKSLFELRGGYGGMIIDSGTSITYLQEDAFDIVKMNFVWQTKLKVSQLGIQGLELCFNLPSDNAWKNYVPKLVFHFKDVDLNLPAENYMVADKGIGVVCLAMGPTGIPSVFGNYQQQNMLVVHDLEKGVLSFVHTKCDRL